MACLRFGKFVNPNLEVSPLISPSFDPTSTYLMLVSLIIVKSVRFVEFLKLPCSHIEENSLNSLPTCAQGNLFGPSLLPINYMRSETHAHTTLFRHIYFTSRLSTPFRGLKSHRPKTFVKNPMFSIHEKNPKGFLRMFMIHHKVYLSASFRIYHGGRVYVQ